jgi:hypothetical protein
MIQKQKKQPAFQLGKEVSKNEQKKVVGGVSTCLGKRCINSYMSCTTSPISYGYCQAVWPASGGQMEPCWTTWCY